MKTKQIISISGIDIRSRTQVKRALWGLAFILPWLIGALYFFLYPLIQSVVYAFCKVDLATDTFKPIGFDNFRYLFTKDPNFITNLTKTIGNVVYQVATIMIFSFLIAILLRNRFYGRTLVRAIFFFPFIISSGVVITILQEQVLMTAEPISQQQVYMFAAPSFDYFIEQLSIPESVTNLVKRVSMSFFNIIWKSGVQIILLLTAVNHIPSSSYEAADIEGATGWEKLWKITFPTISPTLLVVLIYSIIDSFTDYGNTIMRMIRNFFELGQYEYSATIGIVYFVIILALVGAVNYLVGRRIHYVV
ncbi:MAG TPA: sugar ABC transporter permease [Candidatus Avimonas sp.]|nr:sugar ABC transporter permease [Candidatus Avimonas sp.]HQD38315.1 sugar ABC transporter permease [Candidatus Avimonas sp.]